jgi:hypothetical protein
VEFQFLRYFKGSLRIQGLAVVQKLRLHEAEAGGVLGAFERWVVQKLSLHDAKACGVRLFSQLRQRVGARDDTDLMPGRYRVVVLTS